MRPEFALARQAVGLGAAVHATLRSLFGTEECGPASPAGGRPIILLHGFAAASRVLLPLERHLCQTLRRPVLRLQLGERIPLHVGDIRASAQRVYDALDAIAGCDSFEYADVVGHSMGGLVATYLLKRLDRGHRIRRVVTLGTPHRGTPLAALGVLFCGALTRAVWQMLPGSSLVRELSRLPVPAGSQLVSISGREDSIVPPSIARVPNLPGLANHCLAHLNHFGLLQSSDAFDAVTNALSDSCNEARDQVREAA